MNTAPAPALLSESDRKAVSTFWNTNTQGVQWTMILFLLLAVVGSFAVNQGDWIIESSQWRQALSLVQLLLCSFVIYRLVVPRGVQDIQALIAIALLPGLGSTERALILVLVATPVLFFRWKPILRLVGLSSLIILSIMFRNVGVLDQFFHFSDNGAQVCSADNIYKLYKAGSTFKLVREVEFVPGIKLVKHVDSRTSYHDLSIGNDRGTYFISETRPLPW